MFDSRKRVHEGPNRVECKILNCGVLHVADLVGGHWKDLDTNARETTQHAKQLDDAGSDKNALETTLSDGTGRFKWVAQGCTM